MLAGIEPKISLAEFRARYRGEKPYFEYWDGEAIQKTGNTRQHSELQFLATNLLDSMGFDALSEVTIKLDPRYELIPDVIAGERLGNPYPTEPFDVAIEILMPADPFAHVLRKCRMYASWGISQIKVIDPAERIIWSFESGVLRETKIVARRDDHELNAAELWDETDRHGV